MATSAVSAGRRARWRFPVGPSVIAAICLLGVAVLLYPTAASWLTQYEQSQRIVALSDQVRNMSPENRSQAVEKAVAYNASLNGSAAVTAGERLPQAESPGDPEDQNYNELLAADASGLIGRIKIPVIDADLPIYHGTSDQTLREGIGHLQGTALPVGGESTHSVLTGHRGLADATMFTHLDQVAEGDTFTIEVFGEVLTYQVVTTQVVEPEETETLHAQRGKDLITLVTCTPLGINSHRILVTGERIEPTPPEDLAQAGKRPDVPGFAWWVVGLAGALLLTGGYVWYSGRPVSPGRKANHSKGFIPDDLGMSSRDGHNEDDDYLGPSRRTPTTAGQGAAHQAADHRSGSLSIRNERLRRSEHRGYRRFTWDDQRRAWVPLRDEGAPRSSGSERSAARDE
nr:class C sortase [Lysinibacter cavernae]